MNLNTDITREGRSKGRAPTLSEKAPIKTEQNITSKNSTLRKIPVKVMSRFFT